MKNILLSIILLGIYIPIVAQETIDTNTVNSNATVTNAGFLDTFYEDTEIAAEPEQGGENPLFTLVRIILITGVLSFLTWLVIRFFFRRNALAISQAGKSIEILATVPAGLGSYFIIAKLGTLYYLMSLSSDGLRLLDKITDKEAIDFIELNRDDTMPENIKFVDLLENMPEGKPKQALEFLREQIEKLKNK